MKRPILVLMLGISLGALPALAQSGNPPMSEAPPGASPQGASGGIGQNPPGGMTPQPGTQDPTVHPGSTTNPTDDATLEQSVKQQLATDPAFSNVQVSAKEGKVELNGTVPKKNDRGRAKDMAKSVPGVKRVKEHLTVAEANTGAAADSSSGSNPAGSISGNAGTATQPGNSSPAGDMPQSSPNPESTSPPDSQPESMPPHARNFDPAGTAKLIPASFVPEPQQAQPSAASARPEAQPVKRQVINTGSNLNSTSTESASASPISNNTASSPGAYADPKITRRGIRTGASLDNTSSESSEPSNAAASNVPKPSSKLNNPLPQDWNGSERSVAASQPAEAACSADREG